jgi:hypothetical protein
VSDAQVLSVAAAAFEDCRRPEHFTDHTLEARQRLLHDYLCKAELLATIGSWAN